MNIKYNSLGHLKGSISVKATLKSSCIPYIIANDNF